MSNKATNSNTIDETSSPNFMGPPSVSDDNDTKLPITWGRAPSVRGQRYKAHNLVGNRGRPEHLIDDKIVARYINYLGPESKIEYLRLVLCYFTESAAEVTFAAISRMPVLDELEVIESRNACVPMVVDAEGKETKKLKGGGVRLPIEEMLAATKTLKYLWVMNCDYTLEWTIAVLNSLMENKVLTDITMESHPVTATEPRATLLRLLNHNHVLKNVSVWIETSPKDDVDEEILAVIRDNPNLDGDFWHKNHQLHLGATNASMLKQMLKLNGHGVRATAYFARFAVDPYLKVNRTVNYQANHRRSRDMSNKATNSSTNPSVDDDGDTPVVAPAVAEKKEKKEKKPKKEKNSDGDEKTDDAADTDSDSDDDLSDDVEIDEKKLPNFLWYPNVLEDDGKKLTILWGPERLVDDAIVAMYINDLGPESKVVHLRLVLCYFTESAAKTTFEAIGKMPVLDKLEVMETRNACVPMVVDAEGKETKKLKGGGVPLPVEEMLAASKSLKEFYLMNCDYTLEWTNAVLDSLLKNKVLAQIMMEPHPTTATEPRATLLRLLKHNRALENVSVWIETSPKNDVDEEILAAVRNNPNLGWLHLGIKREDGNNVAMIDQMHKLLEKNAMAEPKDEHKLLQDVAVAMAPLGLPSQALSEITSYLPTLNRRVERVLPDDTVEKDFDPNGLKKIRLIEGVYSSHNKIADAKPASTSTSSATSSTSTSTSESSTATSTTKMEEID